MNLSIFSESCHFFYIFVTAIFKEISIRYPKKILKNKDIQNAYLACIIESMSKTLIFFCEILVLTPSFFGSHCSIFRPQSMQENWLILLYEKTKLFMPKIRILISTFLSPNISYFLWTVYIHDSFMSLDGYGKLEPKDAM